MAAWERDLPTRRQPKYRDNSIESAPRLGKGRTLAWKIAMSRKIVIGLFALVIVVSIGGLVFRFALPAFQAVRPTPPAVEIAVASWLLLHSAPAEEADRVNPVPPNEADLAAGAALFQQNCAVCHGFDGGGRTMIGPNVYPRAPAQARLDLAPEAPGLLAASLGLSRMYADDLEQLEAGLEFYDAFYRWCRDATNATRTWPTNRRGLIRHALLFEARRKRMMKESPARGRGG